MKRLSRSILVFGLTALLAVLIIVAAAFWFVTGPEFHALVSKKISETVGPGIAFGSISLAFWPALGIRFHDVTLGGKRVGADEDEGEGANTEEGVTTIRSLACTLRLRPLLDGNLVLSRVYIEGPNFSVERDSEGHWILGGTLQQIVAAQTDRRRGAEAAASASKTRAKPQLSVRDGVIDFEDRRVDGGPVSLQIHNLGADYKPDPDGGPGKLKISIDGPGGAQLEVDSTLDLLASGPLLGDRPVEANVRGTKLGSDSLLSYLLFGLPIRNPGGVFDIEGLVSFSPGEGVKGHATVDVSSGFVEGWGIRLAAPVRLASSFEFVNGEFAMHQARLDAVGATFTKFAAEKTTVGFDWSANNLRLRQFEFDAYGGTWKGSGLVSFTENPSFSLELQADQAGFRELVAAASGKELKEGFETFSGEAQLHGEWTGSDAWQDTLQGSGRVQLAGGEIASSNLIHFIFKAIFDLIPGSSSYLGVDKLESEPTRLERLQASFMLRDARALTEDLDFVTSSYHLEGKGNLGFDGSIQFSTSVTLTTGSIAQVYSFAAVPFRGEGESSFVPIPVTIYGSIDQPHFVPDVSSLSLGPLRALLKTAKGAVGLGKDAGEMLGHGAKRVFDFGRKDTPTQEGGTSPATEPLDEQSREDEMH